MYAWIQTIQLLQKISSFFYHGHNYTVKCNRNLYSFRYIYHIYHILVLFFYFHNEFNTIYPDCLQSNKANISDDSADFLNISSHISNNSINVDLYDKSNSLNFFYKKLVWFSNLHIFFHKYIDNSNNQI